ncbi:iron-siderophore ABC transporter substrate-binding protein [Corynebacterium anserum]|uniref:ABC transporter substrate-binding protein n=1 Tax=Corynebacterium anserum TaxID=2684406 RepID=A0A7G7YQ21_9CORY|nr:iron-siderophore ABC transporter substrate-binding protein [Corynebacterium anserum]MBC2682247.1 ABC transporter substrate-binding protein [Corynebacterium anserum]QNH96591.1 ABC transporter substrate-binding protein [Corynebacterium anserum]
MISSVSLSRRAAIKAVAVLTASSLILTGCARGGDDAASNNDAAGSERIASVGLGDADTLLALGIQPVLIAPWGAEGDVDASGVGPWAKDKLGDNKPATVYGTGTGFTAEILEKISASDPDKIIAVNAAVDAQAKKALNDIAPTTLKPEGTKDWQIPWQDQITQIADAVDKDDEGKQLINETQKTFDDFVAQHKELKGKKAAIVMPYDGKIGLYTSGDGRGQFIENLGFTIPKELEGNKGEFYRDIAPENYSDLNNVDYLFVLDYQGAAETLKKDPTFSKLDVVREGKVRWLEENVGNAMSMPNPLTIPWAVEKFAETI